MKQQKTKIITQYGKEVDAMAPMILSVSRATDVPAFYSDWFFNRLERGYCRWRNPFNGADNYVSFENVRFIVFWSKNPTPLIPYISRLQEHGIKCYIQYTLNDYEDERLEPEVPPLRHRIDTFKRLAEMPGVGAVVWRFDPLILTDKISIDDLLSKIEGIGNQLMAYTEKLVFSFADIASYRKVSGNLTSHGINYREWTESEMLDFARQLSELNHRNGWNFRLATCAEKIDLGKYGIVHNRCIDDEMIARIAWQDVELMKHLGMDIRQYTPDLFGQQTLPEGAIPLDGNRYAVRTRHNRDSGQRKLCGCIAAKDIGQYNTCPHGCLYCYANTSPDSARRNFLHHNPDAETISQ